MIISTGTTEAYMIGFEYFEALATGAETLATTGATDFVYCGW